jgi:hypothetical protein
MSQLVSHQDGRYPTTVGKGNAVPWEAGGECKIDLHIQEGEQGHRHATEERHDQGDTRAPPRLLRLLSDHKYTVFPAPREPGCQTEAHQLVEELLKVALRIVPIFNPVLHFPLRELIGILDLE